ncbi:MAG TPA: YrdB family protein [Anaerolineales bacterium]
MSQNPVNLAVRFILELAALYFIGRWGWIQGDGELHYALAIGLPLLAAFVWGTFRVPGDGGAPRVQVPAIVRFCIELAFFGFAIWGLFDSEAYTAGWIFGGVVLIHYLISYDRIIWLLKQ